MPNISDPKDQTNSSEPTPEQLLKLLDLQIAAKRQRRRETPRQRSAVLALALMIIMGGAVVAFLILQQMVADLPHPGGTGVAPISTLDSQ
jgi:hypothetical protein